MSAVLVIAGVLLLALPGLVHTAGSRLRPSDWAQRNFASLRLGLWSVQLGLALGAAPLLIRVTGAHVVAACSRLVGPALPGGEPVAAISGGAALTLAAVALATKRRTARSLELTRIEQWLGDHRQVHEVDVAVLPTDQVLAYASSGSPPQVVLSRGLSAVLEGHELESVVRHELAHLRHGHGRYLLLASVVQAAFGWLPSVRRSITTLRLSVERWADEEAAPQLADRLSVRAALLKATATMVAVVPSFAPVETIAARLDALEHAPPTPTWMPRALVAAPLVTLTGLVVAGVVLWGAGFDHGIVGLLRFCPLPF